MVLKSVVMVEVLLSSRFSRMTATEPPQRGPAHMHLFLGVTAAPHHVTLNTFREAKEVLKQVGTTDELD